jgi:uncharacterized membrane protein YeaQ/YmgE (transglycosylase-associated protein family)
MLSLFIWTIYGVIVGSISKAIVPGEENFGFVKTVAVGVAGSYLGGAILYLLGKSTDLEPSGMFMGIAGGTLAIVLYNKLTKESRA